jgi:hypothetical protein
MKYTLQDAFAIVQSIEPALAGIGYHAAIGGSLAYRGSSDKDIDIIIYPHEPIEQVNRCKLVTLLDSHGYKCAAIQENGTSVADVYKTHDSSGRLVEWFFMRRACFMYDNHGQRDQGQILPPSPPPFVP